MAPGAAPYVLLYDGECRICALLARWVKRLDRGGHIRIRPIQEAPELLSGIPPTKVLDAMHVGRPDGGVASGGDALPALAAGLGSAPELERLLRASPGAMRASRRSYELLVHVRGRLICRPSSAPS